MVWSSKFRPDVFTLGLKIILFVINNTISLLQQNDKTMTYDLHFHDSENSSNKGFKETLEFCKNYIDLHNGTDHVTFTAYKGGIVQIVCNETGDVVFETEVF